MSDHYPHVRVFVDEDTGSVLIRDGLRFCFEARRNHREISSLVLRTLDRSASVAGPALGMYFDNDENYWDLDDKGWALVRSQILDPDFGFAAIIDLNLHKRFRFRYSGCDLVRPDITCSIEFWLPTELLEERGPGRVRELVLDLIGPYPFCCGYGGVFFNGDLGAVRWQEQTSKLEARYPGMVDWSIRHTKPDKIQAVSWLTFLGQPVLGEVGGVDGLRSLLHSPGTTVQELEGDRAVVTLGPWPKVADAEKGETLPAYDELKQVLKPWTVAD